MASFMDMLNQGIGGLNTPLGMLGMQLMANSGYQPGATGASRLGNAMVGVGQQQMQQQAMQQQIALRQTQAQELQLRQQEAQRQAAVRQAQQQYFQQNPQALGGSPLAAAVMQAGGDATDAAALGKLDRAGQPEMAKMPWTKEVPNNDGTTTHMEYDLKSGTYNPVTTYKTPTMINAELNQQKTGQDMAYKPLEYQLQADRAGATVQNSNTTAERLAMDQAKQQKEMAASAFKKQFDRMEFKQQYRAASTVLDDTATLADEIANSPALNSLYGPNGYVPPIAGSPAADLQTKIDRLKAKGGLSELVALKQQGVALTPVSNTDLQTAQTSFANFDKLQSDKAAKAEFSRAAQVLRRAKEEAATRYNEYDSLFDVPGAGAKEASGPATITDDAGYNALPSGATFTAPDGSLRRKP